MRQRPARAVVALGDSITDGANTTVGANHRYPDFLAARFRATPALEHLGVVNKGIGGNRLLHDGNLVPSLPFAPIAPLFGESALARFDRDVAAQPGARYVIVLLGSTTSATRLRGPRPRRRRSPPTTSSPLTGNSSRAAASAG